jgi:hypothetical protein
VSAIALKAAEKALWRKLMPGPSKSLIQPIANAVRRSQDAMAPMVAGPFTMPG